ncbi:MAG TPA: hypothetical protein VN826_16775, partial [Candidatus Eisenbacteria bacterium]|nr:hypothetical protein [Candidatus Eisenbacteria bacterium]
MLGQEGSIKLPSCFWRAAITSFLWSSVLCSRVPSSLSSFLAITVDLPAPSFSAVSLFNSGRLQAQVGTSGSSLEISRLSGLDGYLG